MNLVPGAGLEPARTLPGPRDFKSTEYCHHEQLTSSKALYQRRVSTGMASCCSLLRASSVTALVTVKLRRKQPNSIDSIGTVDLSAAMWMREWLQQSYTALKILANSCKPARTAGAPRGNKNHLRHGLNPLKKTLYELGYRVLDKRTVAGRALVEWRDDLVRDLGGEENISTQQDAIIILAIKTKLLLDSIDVWLLEQPTLIIKRKRAIIPAVLQRQQLADALSRYMGQLGLERRH